MANKSSREPLSDCLAINRGLSTGLTILFGDTTTEFWIWSRFFGGYAFMVGLACASVYQHQGRDD